MKKDIVIKFESFDSKYVEMVTMAVWRMEDVLGSLHFLDALADEISKSNGLEGELSKWKKASPKEIYEHIIISDMTLHLNTYYTASNVIGKGYEGTNQIFINTKYLKTYSINNPEDLMEIGSNLLHEDSHDKGFDHDYKRTKRRENSLSYILNRAYERAFKKIYALPDSLYFTPWYSKIFYKIRGWF